MSAELQIVEPEAQQLDLRRIGGSDVASIVGLSPWRGPWDVWARIVHGRGEPDRERMRWGLLLEPVVAAEWCRRFDPRGTWTRGVSHAVEPCFRVTPDYVSPERGLLLEIKTTGARDRWDEIPDYYQCQVQLYMHLLGLGSCRFGVLFGGQELETYALDYDREVGGMLVEAALEFWRDYVLTERPPPVDGTRTCRAELVRGFGQPSKRVRPATEDEAELVEELRILKLELARLYDRKDSVSNRLLEAIGSDYGVTAPAGKVIAPYVRGRENTDWQAVRAELVSLVEPAKLDAIINSHTRRSDDRRDVRGYFRDDD